MKKVIITLDNLNNADTMAEIRYTFEMGLPSKWDYVEPKTKTKKVTK